MKKLQSTLPNMLIVLTCIAIVAGGALAKVNEITEGPIKENAEKTLTEGINRVLEAENAKIEKIDTMKSEEGVVTSIVYKTDKGVAVQSIDPKGFGGELKILVGFDEKGCIKGYTVLQHSETPGLGAKVEHWFQKGQKGNIIGKDPGAQELKVTKDGGKDGGNVDAITASTITSKAFLRAVNAAYAVYKGENTDAHTGASEQHHEEKVDAESGASEQHHEGEHHEGRHCKKDHEGRHCKKEHIDRHGNKHEFKK